uniref:aminotransferase class I/II-fold pyridoxal phosphate-dependent enzyme n=1 Tax=uncultured Vagococcus sp. TaxID=189676 RepID=UPI0028D07771
QGIEFHPMATLVDRSNLISLTSVSKAFNLAGLQGANLIVQDEALRERLREKMSVHLPSPFTIGAVMAAYNESEAWLDRLNLYLDETIDWVMVFLARKLPLVRTFRPEGTYVLWLDFQGYGLTPDEIHRRIYQYAGVLLEWGTVSDPDKGHLFERVCLAAPRSRIETAFERLAIEFDEDF